MDNQHRKINGYRELNEVEIKLINEIKEKAEEVRLLVERAQQYHQNTCGKCIDLSWVETGKTDLQKGFMSLVRSVAKPTTF